MLFRSLGKQIYDAVQSKGEKLSVREMTAMYNKLKDDVVPKEWKLESDTVVITSQGKNYD